jgi:hypothetical protein
LIFKGLFLHEKIRITGGEDMALQSRQKKPPKKKQEPACLSCGKNNEFYMSKNPLHKHHGLFPICKECINDVYVELYKRYQDNELAIKEMCKRFNLVFSDKLFESASRSLETTGTEIYAAYFRVYGASKIRRDATYMDSDMFKEENIKSLPKAKLMEPEELSKDIDIPLEDIELFGTGYEPELYKAMRKKYDSLSEHYNFATNMHKEALVKYVKYSAQEEQAILDGEPDVAKKWADLSQKQANSAKINPSQFSAADLQGGLNSFSELFKAIEETTDVISILPQFKAEPMDSLDFLIWSYINYARELEGLPRCSYNEVYEFYDKRVLEYIEKTGDPYKLFEQDYSEENRELIKKHISDIEDMDGNMIRPVSEGGIEVDSDEQLL